MVPNSPLSGSQDVMRARSILSKELWSFGVIGRCPAALQRYHTFAARILNVMDFAW